MYMQYRAKCLDRNFNPVVQYKNYSEIYSFVIAFSTHVRYNLGVNFDKCIRSSHKLVKSMLYRFCSMFVLF